MGNCQGICTRDTMCQRCTRYIGTLLMETCPTLLNFSRMLAFGAYPCLSTGALTEGLVPRDLYLHERLPRQTILLHGGGRVPGTQQSTLLL